MSTHVVTAAKSGSKTKKKPLKAMTATVAPDNLRPIGAESMNWQMPVTSTMRVLRSASRVAGTSTGQEDLDHLTLMTETVSIREVADELVNVTPQPTAVGIEIKTEVLSSTSRWSITPQ
jgi:hypothetical protein